MNIIFRIVEACLLVLAAGLTGWNLFHIFQLESYQLPGYRRSGKAGQ